MANTGTTGEFCWNELMTHDVDTCKDFYKKLFGWETHDLAMEHGTYTLFKNGDKDVGGMMKIPSECNSQIPPHWMSYVYVKNVEEAVKQAKSLGATIKQEPMAVGDWGCFAILQDPAGAHIAIWQSLKSCN